MTYFEFCDNLVRNRCNSWLSFCSIIEMNNQTEILSEPVDNVPLLIGLMIDLELSEILDRGLVTNGNHKGLSRGNWRLSGFPSFFRKEIIENPAFRREFEPGRSSLGKPEKNRKPWHVLPSGFSFFQHSFSIPSVCETPDGPRLNKCWDYPLQNGRQQQGNPVQFGKLVRTGIPWCGLGPSGSRIRFTRTGVGRPIAPPRCMDPVAPAPAGMNWSWHSPPLGHRGL